MAAAVEDNSWDAGLTYITEHIVDELVDTQQVVTINPTFDKKKTIDILRALCDKVVVPFAQRREKILNEQLQKSELTRRDVERELKSMTAEKENIEQRTKAEKEAFVTTEASYARQVLELTTDHQATLLRCDEDISTRDVQIDELKGQVEDLKKKLKDQEDDETKEFYMKDLEESHQKLTEDKKKLEEQIARLKTEISDKETRISQERRDVNKFIAQIGQKNKDLGEARGIIRQLQTRISELESQKDNAEKAARTLTATAEERQRAIDQLKKDIEEYTKRSVSTRGKSSKSDTSAVGPAGTLDTELQLSQKDEAIEELTDENNALRAQVEQLERELTETRAKIETLEKDLKSSRDAKDKADQRVRELENEVKEKADKATGDLEKLKKERDELEVTLRRAQSKAADNDKEISRLQAIERNERELQRRERELAAQLKSRAQQIKGLEDEIERLKQDARSSTGAKGADAEECEREKADLQKQLDKVKTELRALRKDYDVLLRRIPSSNDEIRRLLQELQKMNLEMEEAVAENIQTREKFEERITELTEQNERTEAQLTALTDEYDALLTRSQTVGADMTADYDNFLRGLQERSNEVQADLDREIQTNKTTREQYLERLGQMNEDINKNPASAEANVTKKRVVGLQREIERMASLIKTLQTEVAWFRDTVARFQEARDRVAQRAAEANEDVEAARQRLAQIVAARQPVPRLSGANRGYFEQLTENKLGLASNLISCFTFMMMSVASGREFGLLKWANQPVKRSYFFSALEAVAISLKWPPTVVLWEFITIILTGGLVKWSTL